MEILEGYNSTINDIVKKNNYINNDVKYDIFIDKCIEFVRNKMIEAIK